ncbi:MAG: GNAT family N-acetyltransferase [Myxococcota bacterium]
MSQVELVGPHELDLDAYVALQREAFAELLTERGAPADHLVPAYFTWKYAPPGGPARIAVVREGGRYIAANAMFPLAIRQGSRTIRAWQSCDTATAPDARGKGWFGACLRALQGSLGSDEIFFGFPNTNSVRGFEKLGWRVMSPVQVWTRPVPGWSTAAIAGVDPLDPNDPLDDLRDALATSGRALIDRSPAYLRWRYREHPVYSYRCWLYRGDGVGLAVVRPAIGLGRTIGAVLERLATSPAAERAISRQIGAWATAERAWPTVVFDNRWTLSPALRSGFVPVPARVLPKRQILMGASAGGSAAAAVFDADWWVQMGDWDGF